MKILLKMSDCSVYFTMEMMHLTLYILSIVPVSGAEEVKIYPEIVDLSDKDKQLFCPKQDDQIDNKVRWNREQQPISFGEKIIASKMDYSVKKSIYGEMVLTIKRISKETAARYTCFYNNKPITTYHLKLKTKPIISNHSKTDLVFEEGETVYLWCEVDSVIEFSTIWMLYNANISADIQEMSIGITGSKLQIVNVTRHCSATYRCIAQNEKGKASKDFNVIVKHKPVLQIEAMADSIALNIENNIGDVSTGSRILIRCFVNANPSVDTIQWYADEKLIASKNRTHNNPVTEDDFKKQYMVMADPMNKQEEEALTLLISKMTEDELRKFTCSATNTLGSQSIDLTLRRN